MQRINGRATTQPLAPNPDHRQAQALQAEGDEEEDEEEDNGFLQSQEERRSTARRQTAGEKGDGASLTSPDGNGNSESSAGFVERKTC